MRDEGAPALINLATPDPIEAQELSFGSAQLTESLRAERSPTAKPASTLPGYLDG
ncbi:MAG: hypothetical protein HC780_19135 [Leptolyngbyaceae cyanobacterium CSU_1_3]|nr:hypothetical protein [Leptolyngbyaceae cyanobacterium CSU_1_3]